MRVICAILLAALFCCCASGMAAQSAEINPFAATQLQVDARMARIQQEVDRLLAEGMFTAAELMSRRLGHFQLERAGLEASQVPGPELDAVAVYSGSPNVQIHATDRPVVLALGGNDLIQWSLTVDAGANLQKVIVSGHNGATLPIGVPAGVPVEFHSPPSSIYFSYFSKTDGSFGEAAKTMYAITGLAPSSMQSLANYQGQPFSIGSGSVEWTQQRVLNELQPLYKDATAFQLSQDRAAAEQYRFTALYNTYTSDGGRQSTRIAQMTPVHAIDGTIQSGLLDYKYIAVDPRGPTYYAMNSSGKPVSFDPVTGQEIALPVTNLLGSVSGMTFDTLHNRLVISGSAGDPPGYRFVSYSPANGIWERSQVLSLFPTSPMSLTYSAINDAYYSLESGPGGLLKLDRFDGATFVKSQVGLSQYIGCEGLSRLSSLPCQLVASGDRLVVIEPAALNFYEPLSPLLPHSYLIDPVNGNVTILGALPEPGWMVVVACAGVGLLRRRSGPWRGTKVFVH